MNMATTDILGTIFHFSTYVYFYSPIIHEVFIIYFRFIFGLSSTFSGAYFTYFILFCNSGALEAVNLLLVAALVSSQILMC